MARASVPKTFPSYTIDAAVFDSHQNHVYIGTASDTIAGALYAKAGRRYGPDNRISIYEKKNRFRNGVRMLFPGCKSDSHLIRNCPTMRKAALVYIVLERMIPSDGFDSACSLPINQILDAAQDLPDEV